RAAEVTGSQRHAAAGRTALRHDRGLADRLDQTDRVDRVGKAPVDLGWCGGLAGAVLARMGTKGDKTADDAVGEKWLDDAIVTLGEHRPLRDTSLCHGALGVAEALVALAAAGDERAVPHRDRGAAQLLGALEQFGPRCGTPRGVPSPGLLTGLAGIGFGLLRLGFADQVPSVLLLDPAMPPY
ncbi:MAG TPA: lanthionine synthetase LanC family protein, partial [Pseudonocardiaceae bacterium]|nr:lanthionine synthetase LanC family protein [Pseudonocardiaceae bacterium]